MRMVFKCEAILMVLVKYRLIIALRWFMVDVVARLDFASNNMVSTRRYHDF